MTDLAMFGMLSRVQRAHHLQSQAKKITEGCHLIARTWMSQSHPDLTRQKVATISGIQVEKNQIIKTIFPHRRHLRRHLRERMLLKMTVNVLNKTGARENLQVINRAGIAGNIAIEIGIGAKTNHPHLGDTTDTATEIENVIITQIMIDGGTELMIEVEIENTMTAAIGPANLHLGEGMISPMMRMITVSAMEVEGIIRGPDLDQEVPRDATGSAVDLIRSHL